MLITDYKVKWLLYMEAHMSMDDSNHDQYVEKKLHRMNQQVYKTGIREDGK